MLQSRIRAVVLGLLALLLVGSAMAATASAEAGPFWHHREVEGSGEGNKIEPKAPENFKGKGGTQILKGEPATGLVVELTSLGLQVKGAIFNGEHQGQIKVAIFYQPLEVKINGIVPTECKAMVGQQNQFPNAIVVKGHLAWKWDGTKQQLEEQPQKQQKWDIVFTQVEPQEQENRPLIDLRKGAGSFADIHFVGKGCGVLAGNQKVAGAEVGIPSRPQPGEWSRILGIRTMQSGQFPKEVLGTTPPAKEGFLQHIWVGNGYQPLVLGLTFGENPANLVGQTETEAEQQEISVFPS